MKRFFKKFLNGIIFGLGFFVVFILGMYLVNARSGLQSSPGDKLTSAKWNELVNYSQIPSGQISAFNLSVCPSGRSEFTPAYGRFLRGIDKSGTSIDPDGQRALGNIQEDMIKSHNHSIMGYSTVGVGDNKGVVYGTTNNSSTTTIPNTIGGGSETRSKNVAVLYCVKN